ncbi:MAG: phosphatidylinositol-specific phospholipase C domain-containing protein, partial [Lactobacillus sp.]|nr:phosphatidylinositol-specific phospholipase C domain-containing protein [Lactobacillus sp.]
MWKKVLYVLIIVLLLSSMTSLIFVGCGPNDGGLSISSWMSYINDDALLKNIVIPGSHDTGTYELKFVSQTQFKNMTEQLECGTRYFDLRYDVVEGELVMYHGFHGPAYTYKVMYDDNALTVFSQIKEFLQTHTSETLVLDITNIFDEAKPLLFSTVCEYLKDYAIVNDTSKSDLEFVDNLKLGDCRGKCLILWGADTDVYLNENFIFKRNDDAGSRADCVLHSFYKSNYNSTYASEKYIKVAIPKYIEEYRQVGAGLFVLQGQLTDGLGIFGPRSKEDDHYVLMNEYVASLADSQDLVDINIIMRDFVGFCKNAHAIKL